MTVQDIVVKALELIIAIIVLVATRYLVPWLKTKIGDDTLDIITTWVKEAVHAAEQVMTSNTGAEKKAYVIEFVKKILEENNISISDEELDVLIEAAVKSMNISQLSSSNE